MNKKVDAWTLFKKTYKQNDYVLVITDDDNVYFGRMKYYDEGLSLTETMGRKQFLYWDAIRFICHDGFPVEKLKGADGSDTIELLESVSTEKLIMDSLENLDIGTLVFSDPFLIENVTSKYVQTFYPGDKVWQPETEELLLMQSNDGAVGMLYELNQIYHYQQ